MKRSENGENITSPIIPNPKGNKNLSLTEDRTPSEQSYGCNIFKDSNILTNLITRQNYPLESFHQQIELWENEYKTIKAIPSTDRRYPSRALLLFSELLKFGEFKYVLDLGCGSGRNAIYLAKQGCMVECIDFSNSALEQLFHIAIKENVKSNICIHRCPLEAQLPFKENIFDFVLDSYVSCHFISEELKNYYFRKIYKTLKAGGFLFSSVLSVEDEYYKKFIYNSKPGNVTALDPNNNIKKRLYTENELLKYFSNFFKLVYCVNFKFFDMVLGKEFLRSVIALILKK